MITLLYRTAHWIPPLFRITLRSERNGWQDFTGVYEAGAWRFDLPSATYTGAWAFKFILDAEQWMEGADFTVDAVDGQTYAFGPEGVNFPRRLPVREYGQIQRRYFEPPVLPTDEPYDVIVIGSGIGGGILADAVSDLGYRVLVLEAGGFLFPTHIGNLPRPSPAANPTLTLAALSIRLSDHLHSLLRTSNNV